MVSLLSFSTSFHTPTHSLFFNPGRSLRPRPTSQSQLPPHRNNPLSPNNSTQNCSSSFRAKSEDPRQEHPRTLFTGGFKRPEIKVPNLVLQLSSEEVLNDATRVLDEVDLAVSKAVGIVVLNGGGSSGGKLYKAACLLKSVIRDRGYLLIAERVDIATAINAGGVVLSDQGLPATVARNLMLDSKSEWVFLPVVAKYVQTSDAALNASNFEGADFLIYGADWGKHLQDMSSVLKHVKVPIFMGIGMPKDDNALGAASELIKSGASGLVISLEDLKLFSDYDLSKALTSVSSLSKREEEEKLQRSDSLKIYNGFLWRKGMAGFSKMEDREKEFIETERSVLLDAINVIKKAAPLMEDVSLLIDTVSQLDEPFLLVIVGEFNSGKSTIINALLGKRYLKDGVVPTTNEITFLCHSELDSKEMQHCERHPDGQYICFLPAPILKEMIIIDTPGTNVILQRQQRLAEEFVPRADLLLFVISADRPLTESEVAFLRYTQKWKKKVVFVLNKSDLYQNVNELEEATAFIKENAQKLLNTEDVKLYPVSARSALEAKLSASNEVSVNVSPTNSFYQLEEFLYSFLDGSATTGIERMKLKLETPIRIAEQILSTCQKLVRQEIQDARRDLVSINELINSVHEYIMKMENGGISWKRQILSLLDTTQSSVVRLVESTLRLSNFDLFASYIFKAEKSAQIPATLTARDDIMGPAFSDAQNLLGEFVTWLKSNNAREGRFYMESFENRWPSSAEDLTSGAKLEFSELLNREYGHCVKVIQNFSTAAASKLLEQELHEVFLGTFGGIGVAGLSASLLTSVLQTTLEDLAALGLCSAGGYLAISIFPARRQRVVDKVKRTADALARKLEEAMQKDLLETTQTMENFVKLVGKPYQNLAQQRLDKVLQTQDELAKVQEKLKTLQIEIQNLHVLRY